MSGDEIKSIRKEIKKYIGLSIEYENPYFQLLKRGVGLYISSMPDVYNWILQRLMSEKKLGIVSDKTLCLGIDLPIVVLHYLVMIILIILLLIIYR